jgi:hypothetical protein
MMDTTGGDFIPGGIIFVWHGSGGAEVILIMKDGKPDNGAVGVRRSQAKTRVPQAG